MSLRDEAAIRETECVRGLWWPANVYGKSKETRAKAGWELGDAKDFLGLDASEAEFMEIKLGLARRLRELRAQHSWTQADLAARLGSSQSRVAKMEAADSTVSIDLLVRSLLTAGADRKDVGRAVGSRRR